MAKAGSTEKVVREIRRHTRRRFSAEEKIRIVLEGLRMGNTSRRVPSPSVRAASRISTARRHSGTRCSRFTFIRVAEIVHTRPAVSISSHVASRTSPESAAVSTRNSNASLTAGAADADARTVAIAAATSLWGSARAGDAF